MEALSTSASAFSSLPLGDQEVPGDQPQLEPGMSQPALPSTAPVPVASECFLVDSDDEKQVDVIGRLDPITDPVLEAYVVFKVAHIRPGRLKRPLHADDAIGPNDIALRKYHVVERDMSDPDVLRIRVTRSHGSDVFLCS